LVWIAAGFTAVLFGQPDARPRFEVASVKPSAADARPRVSFPPGQAVMTGVRINDVVPFIYGIQPFLVSGGPGWLAADHYDIVGKFPVVDGAPPERSQTLKALQVLLEDRFQLKVHWDAREVPLYRLTVAKSGFKLKNGDTLPENTAGGFTSRTATRLVRRSVPLSDLTSALAGILAEPVEEATGLTGKYSFVLSWEREPDSAGAGDQSGIEGALRSQLGLNLERGRGQVKTLVIDSAARPAAN